jgi:hypothetical protein
VVDAKYITTVNSDWSGTWSSQEARTRKLGRIVILKAVGDFEALVIVR